MNSFPLISVLMPAYNAEKYIGEAIESILNQSFADFELLVINDGSTDKTEEIILSFEDKRIHYIKNDTNLKLIATLNKGIDLATGKYIARMDADDVCQPKRFAKQIDFLEKHPDYALCGSWAYLINNKGEKTKRIKYINEDELLRISLLFSCPIIHPTVMIRTDILKQFKYNPSALHTEDLDLWLRITNSGLKIANLPEFLFKYRWHDSNISIANEDFQTAKKFELLKPSIEDFLGRKMSDEELELHKFSFQLYHLGNKRNFSINLIEEKKWFEFLSQNNRKVKKYRQSDLDAFLWSRWIVCCISTKRWISAFSIHLPWYKINVMFKTMKLLWYK